MTSWSLLIWSKAVWFSKPSSSVIPSALSLHIEYRGQSFLKTEAEKCMVYFLLTPELVQIPNCSNQDHCLPHLSNICYSARCPPHQGKAHSTVEAISFHMHQPHFNLSQNINIPIPRIFTRFHQAMNLTTESGWMPWKPCQKRYYFLLNITVQMKEIYLLQITEEHIHTHLQKTSEVKIHKYTFHKGNTLSVSIFLHQLPSPILPPPSVLLLNFWKKKKSISHFLQK